MCRVLAPTPCRRATLATALLAATATAAAAQQQDTIRGRVLSATNEPLASAEIVLVVPGDSADQTVARADNDGRFRLVHAAGPRRYLVTAAFLGYAPTTDTLTRASAGQHAFVATFRLVPVAEKLTAVRVEAKRPRPRRPAGEFPRMPGADTARLDLGDAVNGDPAGGLAAAMATMPGLTVIPDPAGGIPSISAFGLSPDQNAVTLNNLNFLGAALPREGLRAQVVQSTYDPGQGGAGAHVQLQMEGGGNASVRRLRGTLQAPWLQWAPSGTPGIDNRYEQFIANGVAGGPIRTNRLFYSALADVRGGRRRVTPLDVVGPDLLRAASIDPDSAAHLLDIAQARGFPLQGSGGRVDNANLGGIAMVRADYIPGIAPGGSRAFSSDYSLLLSASGNHSTGIGTSPFALESSASHTTGGSVSIQAGASLYPGPFLNETQLTAGVNHVSTAPDLIAPDALVQAGTEADSGATARDAAAFLHLGGGGASAVTTTDHRAVELRNQTSWYSVSGKHFFQITLDAAADQSSISERDGPGTFRFESPADFASDQPSDFQRTIADGTRRANGVVAALGLGSIYSPHARRSNFQLQYGVRTEYSRVTSALTLDPVAASVLGVRTDVEPSSLTISPMAGFSARAGKFSMQAGSSEPRFHFSGGVREYTAPLASHAFASTLGTVDPVQLRCVGAAVPAPDWSGYFDATVPAPTQCRSGASSALSEQAPRIAAYAPDYTAPRSWRAQFSTAAQVTRPITARVGATAMLSRRQPELVDRNFAGVQRFTLANEADRPVFVDASGIDAASGRVSPSTSRLTEQLGPVTQQTSTGELKGVQLTGNLGFRPKVGSSMSFRLAYAFKDYRARLTGFGGTTAGDPRVHQWSTAAAPTHTLVASATFPIKRLLYVNAFAQFTSGVHFTPMVGSDINGDGYLNDRAFVFDPALAPSAETRDAMAALLNHAPHWAASCLEAQRGRIAGTNSCTGPWTTRLNAVVSFDRYRLGFGNRGSIQLIFTNLLAGADALLHGANGLHGWGQPAFPDARLLTVRGFDPATRRYQYDVNPFFGSSAAARLGYRAPFSVSIDVRLNIGPNQESSWLKLLLRPLPGDSLLTEPEIRQRIAHRPANLYDLIVRMGDSLGLGLDTAQVAAISGMAERYGTFRDSLYDDLATFLASLHGEFGGAEARERWHDTYHSANRAVIVDAPALRRVLTKEQYLRIPLLWRQILEQTPDQVDRGDRGPLTGRLP
ncbi:MAG TPA: carboxypeptidase-like regulatory domain-containing protein [Gemmatimonadaceae bacterium]|nr:carboxypeptidase-like regulatory domain-containing protein [Gemmatimonadaceae bacterium]